MASAPIVVIMSQKLSMTASRTDKEAIRVPCLSMETIVAIERGRKSDQDHRCGCQLHARSGRMKGLRHVAGLEAPKIALTSTLTRSQAKVALGIDRDPRV